MVYNDFYVGENCDVDIVAGCSTSATPAATSRHDGAYPHLPARLAKSSHVRYSAEKHYGERRRQRRARDEPPTAIVYLDEGASIGWRPLQIRGIDSTRCARSKIVCGKNAEAVITRKAPSHSRLANSTPRAAWRSNSTVKMRASRVISRSVAQDESQQVFHPVVVGNSRCFGHVQCDSIIMGKAKIESIPAITANSTDAQLIHEAAIGKIAGDQLLKLQTLGLHRGGAEDTILKGASSPEKFDRNRRKKRDARDRASRFLSCYCWFNR
ncbi:MAG: SufD family Fe-S cluster assembly protein [Oscillibacter sp.]